MKSRGASQQRLAFTLPELLVVLAIVFVLAMMAVPSPAAGPRAYRVHCVNNLKNVAIAFRIFAEDNEGQFPFTVSSTNGGTRELHAKGDPFAAFLTLSNELSTPKIVHCRMDTRPEASAWTNFSNQHVSYFLNTNADQTNPTAILAGDRNIEYNGKPIPTGRFVIPAGASFRFGPQMHKLQGNACRADGSVQEMTNARMLAETNHNGYVLAVP